MHDIVCMLATSETFNYVQNSSTAKICMNENDFMVFFEKNADWFQSQS